LGRGAELAHDVPDARLHRAVARLLPHVLRGSLLRLLGIRHLECFSSLSVLSPVRAADYRGRRVRYLTSEPSERSRWRADFASSDPGYSCTTNWSCTIACAFSPRSRCARAFFRCAEA